MHNVNVNPYESFQALPPAAFRRRADFARHVAATLPGLVVVVSAAARFSDAARSADGAAAGSILLVVGCVVGKLLADQRGRPLTILISTSFAVAICSGWVDHERGELTLWAFACICAGILWGACTPFRELDHDGDVIDGEVLPSGIEDTTLRS